MTHSLDPNDRDDVDHEFPAPNYCDDFEGARARKSTCGGANQLRLLTLDEYVQRPPVSWLVRDLVPAESIIVVFGAPKSGKTYATLDMTMHASHGMHWHGHTIQKPLRVAYLAGEGYTGLRVRLHAWRRHHETDLRGDFRLLPQSLPLAERIADVIDVLQEYQPHL